ncbi:type iii restriction-modification system methyltransferase [Moraxella macacae 0408225]|uniref:site-specific DNA-methyltransferase (adenine-specific) n=1 Tax=Moraxella macacae 0408225 TaxID=1230338 RepID=L2F8P5_9GAMM|nr:site-specific DNA-methyltransferase [Moraxella macacae]ELA09275.1 type iii restriction-modification system methyltransferase [Moraxella macacae 0408225]
MTEITQKILFSNTQPESEQKTEQNEPLALLKQHFAHCFDKNGAFLPEKMAQTLQASGINTQKEYYNLNWLGKSYAKILKDQPPETLLSEDIKHNQQPENQNSQNVLIQGDNLEVLKHLKHAYKSQIKMIYIDPPYNTGSDGFVYQDDRKFTPEQLVELGMDREEAERVLAFTAKKSNSHAAWLTFMYPRLYVARELLKDDGVIFISIDDNEQAQLKLLCDEVFGEENFITTLHIELSATQGMKVKAAKEGNIVKNAEFILVYSKNGKNNIAKKILIDPVDYDNHYNIFLNEIKPNIFEEKKLTEILVENENIKEELRLFNLLNNNKLSNKNISIAYKLCPNVKNFIDENANLVCRTHTSIEIKEDFLETMNDKFVYTYYSGGGRKYLVKKDKNIPIQKILFSEKLNVAHDFYQTYGATRIRGDWWAGFYLDMGNVSKEGNIPYPNGKKPVRLIKQLAYILTENDDLILDFFAGSGTTAHAVMQLNAEDSGVRKYILVQLPENLDDSLQKATGEEKKSIQRLIDILDEVNRPHLISEITQERLIRSAKQIRTENPDYSGDLGFKIFNTQTNFQPDLPTDFNKTSDLFPQVDLTETQLHTLLTTWRVYDGSQLPEKVQAIDLAAYTAYFCRQHLYLLASGFTSNSVKALIERLDNDPDFIPERIVLFGANMESAMQKELVQAVQTYANKKELNNLSVLARY